VDPELERVLELIAPLRRTRPFALGVTGSVAVGKSTFSDQLKAALAPAVVEIVGTDGFLHDNETLRARGALGRKGYPDTYDIGALTAAVAAIREGPALFPGYSHVIYDVDAALARRIEPPDVLIVEGLGLERGAAAAGLDALLYLDAEEAHIEAWFVERFVELWRAAEHDPQSFYRRFRDLDEDRVRSVAAEVWGGINLPNLREHIGRARTVADIVVRKRRDHAIETVLTGERASYAAARPNRA
jgi:type I pantothenate kinase